MTDGANRRTKLQEAAQWMSEAGAGDTYIYHMGWSLADERRRDKGLDRVATALALAAGIPPIIDNNDFRLVNDDNVRRKTPPKIELYTKRMGRQTAYIARRLNVPSKDAFVQTADPRVGAYGMRNRIKENIA